MITLNLNNIRTPPSSIILIWDDDLAESVWEQMSDALQKPNTRGQLSLTESIMLATQCAPGLCGLVMMTECLFKMVTYIFLSKEVGGSYMDELLVNAKFRIMIWPDE